jgi:hypothetical protein
MSSLRVLESGTSRGGRRFEASHEKLLYPSAIEAARSLPGAAAGVLVVPELHSPLGVPDFVAFVGADAAIERRLAAGVPPIVGPTDLALMAVLHENRGLSVATVSREVRMSSANVEARLRRLARAGAVDELGSAWVRNPALTPSGRVFAIEAKLKDWRKALQQSRGYRTWANNYVLVIGQIGPQATSDARGAVKADGGGLYIDGKWLAKPTSRAVSTLRQFEAFERLASALLPGPALAAAEVI